MFFGSHEYIEKIINKCKKIKYISHSRKKFTNSLEERKITLDYQCGRRVYKDRQATYTEYK